MKEAVLRYSLVGSLIILGSAWAVKLSQNEQVLPHLGSPYDPEADPKPECFGTMWMELIDDIIAKGYGTYRAETESFNDEIDKQNTVIKHA